MKQGKGLLQSVKRSVRELVRRSGYEIVRIPDRYRKASYDATRVLPDGAAAALRADHPHLLDLRRRYAQSDLPMAARTMWRSSYLEQELDLRYFRGDNPYVWQFRNLGADAHYKYYFLLRDIAQRDSRGLLKLLGEDGLFGCWTFDYPGWPTVSRDLLDSINELYFLDRHTGLLQSKGWSVLDIGAGYGRLAHRALTAIPDLAQYICVDAVPESTFLCEYYLRFRGCQGRSEVIPLDQLEAQLPGRRIELAVNIHSFSEMSTRTIEGWLSWLDRLDVGWLLIVPNDGDQLLTMENDGERREFNSLLSRHGYELTVREAVFADPTMRQFMGVWDHYFLFRRRASVAQ